MHIKFLALACIATQVLALPEPRKGNVVVPDDAEIDSSETVEVKKPKAKTYKKVAAAVDDDADTTVVDSKKKKTAPRDEDVPADDSATDDSGAADEVPKKKKKTEATSDDDTKPNRAKTEVEDVSIDEEAPKKQKKKAKKATVIADDTSDDSVADEVPVSKSKKKGKKDVVDDNADESTANDEEDTTLSAKTKAKKGKKEDADLSDSSLGDDELPVAVNWADYQFLQITDEIALTSADQQRTQVCTDLLQKQTKSIVHLASPEMLQIINISSRASKIHDTFDETARTYWFCGNFLIFTIVCRAHCLSKPKKTRTFKKECLAKECNAFLRHAFPNKHSKSS